MTRTQETGNLPLSVLELRWVDLPGEMGDGWFISARRFLDFVVDGRSLYGELGGGNITPLGWSDADWHGQVVNRLLLLTPADLAENRQELYVCSECGDTGCGSITAVVTRQDDRFVWSDFAHYVNYSYTENEHHTIRRQGYEHVGPFAFDAAAYRKVLQGGLETLKALPFDLDASGE
jgi:hypothetical protein